MSFAHRDKERSGGRCETITLKDGAVVAVREVRPGDAAALKRLVGRLSERTSYLRYFGGMKELSEAMARRFAEVDGVDRFALVALDPDDEDEVVAVVRYDREGESDAAEYAALVEDRFQGRGLGMALSRMLVEAARERGVGRLHALVMPDNVGMIHVLDRLGLPGSRRWEEGVQHFEMAL